MAMLFHTSSADETRNLGKLLGKVLSAGDIVLLFGDLGAGKTTLVQGVAAGLGVSQDEYVRSPTFTLINQYQGRVPVHHIDLYRIESAADMVNIGLEDALDGEGAVLVEWAEKLFHEKTGAITADYKLDQRIEIRLNIVNDDMRSINIKGVNLDETHHGVFSLQ